MEHGKFRDSCEHLTRELSCTSLVLVDFLGNLKGGLPSLKGLGTKLLSQVTDFFIDKLFLEKGFLLVVEALLQDMDLG